MNIVFIFLEIKKEKSFQIKESILKLEKYNKSRCISEVIYIITNNSSKFKVTDLSGNRVSQGVHAHFGLL